MKIRSITRVLALCATSILASHASLQAEFTQIYLRANDGVGGITSTAYIPGPDIVSSWSGGWDATIGSSPTFLAFCLDIGNSMYSAKTYNYEEKTFTVGAGRTGGDNDGTPPDPTWATDTSGLRAAWIYAKYHDSVNTASERSAMCIAIWEALYEGSGTLDVTLKGTSERTFQATTVPGRTGLSTLTGERNDAGTFMTVADLANYWLSKSTEVTDFSKAPTAIWWAEAQCNDPQSIVGPVPEPSTIIAGALLLLPFGASTIRRFRKNTKA